MRDINRREVLKSVGVSSSALFGFSGGAVGTESESITIRSLSGSERSQAISSALSDNKSRLVRGELGNGRMRPIREDALCNRVTPSRADPYRVVVVPFAQDGSSPEKTERRDEEVLLRWIETEREWTELGRVVGYRIVPVDRQNGHPVAWEATTYHVNAQDVVSQTEHIESPEPSDATDVGPNDIIGPPPAGGCDPPWNCLGAESQCGWDWVCVVGIAASLGSLTGCSTCASTPNPFSCGVCISSAVAAGVALTCDPTTGCDLVYSCDPCFCENPIPPGC